MAGKQLYGAVGTLYCSIYAADWTDLRSALAQAVKHNQPAENAAGRQQGNQPQSYNVCSTSCVALSAWSLLSDSHTGCTVEESVCLSGAGRQHSNPHARRTRRACGAGLSVSEELAMLGSHSAGRNTVHDTTVPAAAVICNLLAQQHAHHACFGVLVRSNRPCTVQPVHG
jgi:hypothetical protein